MAKVIINAGRFNISYPFIIDGNIGRFDVVLTDHYSENNVFKVKF